nr:hypothetical protein [Micromonospora maritima]
MDRRHPRRRLRSATVQLGALTALALALTGCNNGYDDDDDDCALGPAGGGGDTVAVALLVPAPATAARGYRSEERRVGKECSERCRSRWSPYH